MLTLHIVDTSSQNDEVAAVASGLSPSSRIGRFKHNTTQCCIMSQTLLYLMNAVDTSPSLAELSVLKTGEGKRIRIIKRLSPYWRIVGTVFNFDKTGNQVDIIEGKHRNDPEACCQAILQHWLKGNGVQPCSWRTLIELVEDCDQEVLAEEIQHALTLSSSK